MNPLEKQTQYWNQGRMMYYFGGSIEDCEYTKDTWRWHDWIGGFEEAETEYNMGESEK